MSYDNNIYSTIERYEINTLKSFFLLLTTGFIFLSFLLDNTYHLWLYFIGMAILLTPISYFLKKKWLYLFIVISGFYMLSFYIFKQIFYDNVFNNFSLFQILFNDYEAQLVLIMMHYLFTNYVIWKACKTAKIEEKDRVEEIPDIICRTNNEVTKHSRFRRKQNRRSQSSAHLSTSVKSGKYRG